MEAAKHLGETISTLISTGVDDALNGRLRSLENRVHELTGLVRQLVDQGNDEVLLNKKEACKLLGVSYPTLRSMEKKGLVKPIMSDSKTIRYSKTDLLKAKLRKE